MAISKYERDLDIPGSGVLLRLAQALGVKTEYFFRARSVTLTVPAYRKRCSLRRRQEQAVLGQVQEWLERYFEIEDLLSLEPLANLSELVVVAQSGQWVVQLVDWDGNPAGPPAEFVLTGDELTRELYVRYRRGAE